MKFIDTVGYPKHIAEWLTTNEYDYQEGVVSATSLLNPVRMKALTERHWNELEMDIQHLESSRMGHAVHDSLEKAPMSNVLIQEKRFYTEIDGVKISGKPDLITKANEIIFNGKEMKLPIDRIVNMDVNSIGHLKDYKTTKTWKWIYGSGDDDYIKQLSTYRYILFKNGYFLDDKGEIDFFFTNWQKKSAEKDKSYPQNKIRWKMFDLMTTDETEKWIKERLTLFKSVENTPDDELPECTKEEIWFEEDKYAIMKGKNIKATKVLSDEKEAEVYIEYILETKPKLKRED